MHAGMAALTGSTEEMADMVDAMQGIKVLDFSMGVAGPHIGMLCAQHGADVVKIEPPAGDWGRVLGRQYGDLSAFSAVYNRGKRSLALDLKDSEAQRVLSEVAAQADVIIEAFRPGVMKRFGLDYESVRARNPGVIYVSVTGFGQEGPMVEKPATDAVLQAFTGLMNLNKDKEGRPQRVDMILIDVITGLYGFQAVAAALLARGHGEKTGRYVDCSLMKCAVAFQAPKIVEYVIEGGAQAMYVPLGIIPTSDGNVSVSVMHDHHFVALCNALGRADVGSSELYDTRAKRIEREKEVMDILRAEFGRRSTAEITDLLTRAEVLHAPVQNYEQLLTHEQMQVTSAFNWVRQDGMEPQLPMVNIPGTPAATSERRQQAPHIGEHSLDVLRQWEVPESMVSAMLARGAIAAPKA
jgi:crotonobetainyl-CoA:carnitine CoA-transferase CaiB-like acyl-CoA transferase